MEITSKELEFVGFFQTFFNQNEKWSTKSIAAEYNFYKSRKSIKNILAQKHSSPDSSDQQENTNEIDAEASDDEVIEILSDSEDDGKPFSTPTPRKSKKQ